MYSLREGSYFSKSKLPLDKYIHLLFQWSQDIQSKDVSETLGISGKKVNCSTLAVSRGSVPIRVATKSNTAGRTRHNCPDR